MDTFFPSMDHGDGSRLIVVSASLGVSSQFGQCSVQWDSRTGRAVVVEDFQSAHRVFCGRHSV